MTIKDGCALLITERLIDCHSCHDENLDITWELSDLRKWLNEEFIEEAFSEAERDRIVRKCIVQ